MDFPNVLWSETAKPEVLDEMYEAPTRETRLLKAGWRLTPEHAPFVIDTIWDKDIQVALRDGVKIRADIFRPEQSGKVPALVAWSPYGKSACHTGGFNVLNMIPGRVGVLQSRLSGFEKFEAPDPAEWTSRGYAIVNPDPRGVYDSEGDLYHFGTAEGKDGYDVVEEIAGMDWCNGSVALVGNSWLGIAQWFIAAEQPPHLKCIAPLEGASDLYREILCRGGIPQIPFWAFLSSVLRGRNCQEDIAEMLKTQPLINEYWSDKRARISQINVPVYALASYSTFLHTFGSFRGFMETPHDKKWLRVHPHQEWYDLYKTSTNDELQLFFDHYTKGIDNKWEETPKARVSILRFNEDPVINKNFTDWPIPNTEYQTLYLTADQKLIPKSTTEHSTTSIQYQSDVPSQQMDADSEEVFFYHTFTHQCLFIGCARAVLYLSCEDFDDMDVFVQLRKADKAGNLLQNINIPTVDRKECNMPDPVDPINPLIYLGPSGCLRASHRALDTELSKPWWPEPDCTKSSKVPQGEIVKLEIGLWQTGIAFEAGEQLVLKVSGHNMTLAEFPPLRGAMPNFNVGVHNLHIGGEFASHLVVPIVNEAE